MSLHKFADMVAKQGRGDDSLLIHMTPDEVRNLQKFAEANGKTLTINPNTGLPEAGMLSDLFKTIAPIALGAFLGPAGVALGGPGLTAGMAGLATGGITALATGSLSRGLMAGLGAYGGAGLGESLMGAGTGALSSQITGEIARDKAAEIAAGQLGEEEVGKMVSQRLADTSTFSKLGAGLGAITDSGSAAMQFAKQNAMPLAAAAAPIMAGAMVPTTTKMPENTNPAYIRQKLYDPYTQTYKSLAPVKASEFGNRNFSDAYTNPQTGQMGTLQPRAPSGFAGGGIVALANGGVPGYADGGYTDQQVKDWFLTNKGATDQQIADAMQTFKVGTDQIARATGTQGQEADYNKRFVNTLIAPTTDASEFLKATGSVGLQNQALANAMQSAGLSQGAQYALTHADSDAGFTKGIIDASTGKPIELYNQIGYKAGALPGDQGGLEGLYGNINYVASGLQNLINTGKMSVADAQNAALAELARTGVSVSDVNKATGTDFGSLFKAKKPEPIVCGPGMELNAAGTACVPKKIIDKVVDKTCGTGYHWDEATQSCVKNISAVDTTTTTVTTPTSLVTVPATALPVGVSGTTGPSIFGGGATVNPNGTITTSPVIPGIPVGGFTGMESLRNAYTTGGGSLGYIPKAPKTMAEFEQLYNKQTGDSLAAYDYLMGKGGGKYPVQSKAASTAEGIMRPYWSAGMKYKPRFLTAGKDGTVTESSTNPNAPKAGDAKATELTKAKTIDIVDDSGNNRETYTAVLQEDGTYLAGNGKRYDVTGKQIAAGGGMMGYAVGGGLGSLGSYSDGGRLLKGPGDGVSDSIPATIGRKQQPARLADGEFVIPARIVSELGNGSTDAGAKKLYAMMDRVQRARGKTTGKNKVAANSRSDKYLPA